MRTMLQGCLLALLLAPMGAQAVGPADKLEVRPMVTIGFVPGKIPGKTAELGGGAEVGYRLTRQFHPLLGVDAAFYHYQPGSGLTAKNDVSVYHVYGGTRFFPFTDRGPGRGVYGLATVGTTIYDTPTALLSAKDDFAGTLGLGDQFRHFAFVDVRRVFVQHQPDASWQANLGAQFKF